MTSASRADAPHARIAIPIALATYAYLTLQVYLTFEEWGHDLFLEPWLINNGFTMYADIVNQHSPLLTYLLAALYKVTGYATSVGVVLLTLNALVSAFLVRRLSDSLGGPVAGLISLLSFALLWTAFGGSTYWFDAFLVPLQLLAVHRGITGPNSFARWLSVGLILGVATLVKQQALGTVVAVPLIVAARGLNGKHTLARCLLATALGIVLPIAAWAIYEQARGNLTTSLWWMLIYNLAGQYGALAAKRPHLDQVVKVLLLLGSWSWALVLGVGPIKSDQLAGRLIIPLIAGAGLVNAFPRWEDGHLTTTVAFTCVGLGCVMGAAVAGTRPRWPEASAASGRPTTFTPRGLLVAGLLTTLGIGQLTTTVALTCVAIVCVMGAAVAGTRPRWPEASAASGRPTTFTPRGLLVAGLLTTLGVGHAWAPTFDRTPAWSHAEPIVRYLQPDYDDVREMIVRTTRPGDRIYVLAFGYERLYMETGRLPAGSVYQALPWYASLANFGRVVGEMVSSRRAALVVLATRGEATFAQMLIGPDELKERQQELRAAGYDLVATTPRGVEIWLQPGYSHNLLGSEDAEKGMPAAGA